ncbi:MAG: DNA-processing protein DprA [Candidatus Nanopelagicales bacterium]
MRTSALGDPDYPGRLVRLGAPAPPRVWWRGVLPDPTAPAVAVVGVRAPGPAGRARARAAVERAVARGAVVVSGLSPGVDAVVHARCVDLGGVGLAVVGGGADVTEDDELAALADALVAGGGAVLALRPPGSPVTPAGRRARCPVQVVFADSVEVAELGGPDDGTRVTVESARRLGVPLTLPPTSR